MLVTFQYPIIDFRCLFDNTYKLSKPNWPIPDDELMMKFFGLTKRRRKGGLSSWSGEHKYCTSRNAIKIPNLDSYRIKFSEDFSLVTEGAFRRLNANGNFLAKLEVGFSNPIEDYYDKIPIKADSFGKLLVDTSKIEVHIKNPIGDKIVSTICSCSKAVSELYLYSTSNSEGLKKDKLDKCWVTYGEPLCVVEYYDLDNKLELPKGSRLIARYDDLNVELYHYWIYLPNNKKIRTWIIKKLYWYSDNDCSVRDLRLNLLRINAEKETLRKLLHLLQNKGFEFTTSKEKIDTIGNYLKLTSSKLLKNVRYGFDQKGILDVALCAEDKAQTGELESYMEALSFLKNKYINKNLGQMTGNGFTINMTGGEIGVINVIENGNIINN